MSIKFDGENFGGTILVLVVGATLISGIVLLIQYLATLPINWMFVGGVVLLILLAAAIVSIRVKP